MHYIYVRPKADKSGF